MKMAKPFQFLLLAVGVIALLAVGGEIIYSIAATTHGSTPVRASLSPDSNVLNGVQGNAEITVQGLWNLDIVVTGSAGRGEASVPITATAPPALPTWLGWVIGGIPLYGLFVFLLLQRGRKARQKQAAGVE